MRAFNSQKPRSATCKRFHAVPSPLWQAFSCLLTIAALLSVVAWPQSVTSAAAAPTATQAAHELVPAVPVPEIHMEVLSQGAVQKVAERTHELLPGICPENLPHRVLRPDGKPPAEARQNKNKWTWVIDGLPGPEFDVISEIDFTQDGKHSIYGGANGNPGEQIQGSIVRDGKIIATYQGEPVRRGWLFGQHLRSGICNLDPFYVGVGVPTYAPDGKPLYAARRADDDVVVFADGVPGPSFENVVSPIAVSSDARHFAYIGKRRDSFVEVRDHKPGPSFPAVRAVSLVDWIKLNDDGSHLAYDIVRGGSAYARGATSRALHRVVIDSRGPLEQDVFYLGNFSFSADGKHYVYEVAGADGRWLREGESYHDRVVLDGVEGELYDELFPGTTEFIGSDTVQFVVRNGDTFLKVTERLR